MKGKIIKLLILSALLTSSILAITKVVAYTNVGHADVGENSCGSSSSSYCYTKVPSGGSIIEGLRISIVDENGNRIAGTTSIDVVNSNKYLTNVTGDLLGTANLKFTSLYRGGTKTSDQAVKVKTISTVNGNLRTKNEVVAGSANGSLGITEYETAGPQVYYWRNLPNVTNSSSTAMRNFFLNLYKNEYEGTFRTLMQMLGYTKANGTKNQFELNNHEYMLIEPLLYVQYHYWNTRPAAHAYYGTGTEVYKMTIDDMAADPVLKPSKQVTNKYAVAVYVKDQNAAGLTVIQPGSTNDWGPHMLTNEGTSSAHYWLGKMDDCCGPEHDPHTCYLDDMVVTPATRCEEGTTGKVSDTDNWNCIFKQKDAAIDTFAGQFYKDLTDGNGVKNPYCTIACREEIDYIYPTYSAITVAGGFRFTVKADSTEVEDGVTVLGPVTVDAVKQCKTAFSPSETQRHFEEENIEKYAKIDYKKFTEDYKIFNNNMIRAWDEYQKALLASRAADAANQAMSNNAGGYSDGTRTCGTSSWVIYGISPQGHEFNPNITCDSNNTDPVCTGTAGGSCTVIHDNVNNWDNKYCPRNITNNRYPVTAYSATVTYKDSNGTTHRKSAIARKSACGEELATITTAEQANIDNTRSDYNGKKAARDKSLEQINQCSGYTVDYKELDPEIIMTFTTGENGKYNSQVRLDKSLRTNEIKSTWYTNESGQTSQTSFTSKINSATCGTNGVACSTKDSSGNFLTVPYPINKSVEITNHVVYDYNLPDMYRYISKDGISFSDPTIEVSEGTRTTYTYYEGEHNYREVTTSNFPIEFKTETGVYDYYLTFGENIFGKDNKYTRYANWLATSGTIDNGDFFAGSNNTYKCPIIIRNCITERCEDETDKILKTGLYVIYRPISLTDPFPYIDGTGRDPGSNWAGRNLVDTYIHNNRGVKEYEVYNLKPMYQFVLNSANIRAIRTYNSSLLSNYNDFNLSCKNGRYCKSQFLQEGNNTYFTFTDANSSGGTCFNATDADWESCRAANAE